MFTPEKKSFGFDSWRRFKHPLGSVHRVLPGFGFPTDPSLLCLCNPPLHRLAVPVGRFPLVSVQCSPLEAVQMTLTETVGLDRYSLWFEGRTHLELVGTQLRIGVPNLHFQQWMEGRFGKQITQSAKKILGEKATATFHIDPNLFQETRTASKTVPFPPSQPSQPNPVQSGQSLPRPESTSGRENPSVRHRRKVRRLEHFVTSTSNRAAVLASKGLATGEMDSHRLLILHGSTGLGKSHLLEGMAHQRRISFPGSKILLQTAEEFANDFLDALRTHKQSFFRKRMRCLDLWLVDDLEGLIGKQRTQEEFANTLDALSRLGATVVLALQKTPQESAGIIGELKTRIGGGLVCGLHPMDLGQRKLFLAQIMAQAPKLCLEERLLELMARRVRGSGRECEGMVQTLKHLAWATGTPPNEAMIRNLTDSHHQSNRKVISVGDVVEAISPLVGVAVKQIKDKSRSPKPSQARLLAMYYAKELTGATAKEVAVWFGRQHSTILSAHKKIAGFVSKSQKFCVGTTPWCIRELGQLIQSRLGWDVS